MGFEYRIRFADPDWYLLNRDRLAERIRALPHFKSEEPEREFRLKDDGVKNSWSYDLRVFLGSSAMEIEVSGFTSSFSQDLRGIIDWIRQSTSADLVDDDGVVASLLR
jgi:hypothetical protein